VQVKNKKSIKRWVQSEQFVIVMTLPALLLLSIFIFYPFAKGVQMSFTNWDGFSQHFQWVGLSQYKSMLTDPKIQGTFRNTLIYGLGSTIFQNFFGLAIALLLDQKIRGSQIARTIVYMPAIISALIMGYVWYFFFQYSGGAINDIVVALGMEPVNWLEKGSRAVWIITGVNTFQYLGIAMIIYLAGLQSIPRDYYEAAEIDGASSWLIFKSITLPLLLPAITISVIMNIIGGLKLFDVIMAMTGGGPGFASQSLSTMMYNLYFIRQDAGGAAALGNMMFVLISVISMLSLKYLRDKEAEL
jgi:raffinose/stachyose/melibiose transport system permease protein